MYSLQLHSLLLRWLVKAPVHFERVPGAWGLGLTQTIMQVGFGATRHHEKQ